MPTKRQRSVDPLSTDNKTPPRIHNTSQNPKTLPRIQNTSQNPKPFPESKNTSQNSKYVPESKTLPRIQKHFPESKTRPSQLSTVVCLLYFFRLLLWFICPNSPLLRSCRRILIWTARTSLSGWSLANQNVAYHPAGTPKFLSVSWSVNKVELKDVFKDDPNNSFKTYGSCSSCLIGK